ncbi:hypothetical protein N7448_005751 [Penicillium atrosanguineum]|nr:hypothetical protein N7448_005751 [Penicillium atrosanguineum]
MPVTLSLWSRLIGGSRALSKTSRATSPTERLTAFKRACNALQSTAHARTYIERLNSILSDESRGPVPHPYVAYAASSQIFVTVTKLALLYYDDRVLRSATIFFNTLIDAEVDGIVDNRLFARALVDLVRRADKASSYCSALLRISAYNRSSYLHDEAKGAIPLPLQLQQDDPIVRGLLSCVETFFINSVIVKLVLTGVLMSLASSHLFSLDGWVPVDPANYDTPKESSDELDSLHRAYQIPTWPATASPTLTAVLQRLVDQVCQWQQDLPDFDVLVAARRDLLHLGERPQTPTRSWEPSEPAPTPVDRSRLSYPGSPDASVPASRGRSPNTISSPAVASLRGESSRPAESRGSSGSRAATAETLRQRLATPFPPPDASNSECADPERAPVTLGHVLTNVVLLYEFLLELSAVVQARGSLFEEAGYT